MTSATDTPARPDWRFGVAVAGAFFAVTLPRTLLHVPWRDEWHTWQVVTTTRDVAGVFAILRYDGHPALWYAILWLAACFTKSVAAMQAIHATIAAFAVGVIGVAAPLARSQRLLLAGGYFFAFEYAVVSRSYGLGVLCLLLAAAIETWRPRAYVGVGVALALAVQANAFAALLATTFAAWLAIRWWAAGRPATWRFVAGGSTFLASLAFAAWTIRAAPDIANTPATFDLNLPRASAVAAAFWRAFVPMPDLATVTWWNSNVLDFAPNVRGVGVVEGGLGLTTVGLAVALLPGRRGVRALWIAGATLIAATLYFKVPGFARHHGHLFVGLVLARWLGHRSNDTTEARDERWRATAWTALLAVQCAAGAYASIADLRQPFTAAARAAAFIESRYPRAAVVGLRDYSAATVAGFLGRPIFFAQADRWGTFVRWDRRRDVDPAGVDLAAAAEHAARDRPGQPVLLVLSLDVMAVPDPRRFRPLARFGGASIFDEWYVVFEFAPSSQPDRERTHAR